MKKTLLLLFVCLFVGISHAQAQVTVKGTVISSENNEPVIGASVLVKGTTNGTITDINGQFTLTNISPTNKTIIVSFIGMETQEVTIKPEMKIVMTSTTEVMEEVLVVAYGTAKKSAFTGSAKMIHTEQITKRPVTNVIESLSGQVAGLQMTMTNGQPGETPSILIRGISSMSAKTDPLIVLD
ncbi:TonB-dependent receptor plug domain-containing protein, partial [Phocaeicola vulgatus]